MLYSVHRSFRVSLLSSHFTDALFLVVVVLLLIIIAVPTPIVPSIDLFFSSGGG